MVLYEGFFQPVASSRLADDICGAGWSLVHIVSLERLRLGLFEREGLGLGDSLLILGLVELLLELVLEAFELLPGLRFIDHRLEGEL